MRSRRRIYRVAPPLRGARYGWRIRTPEGHVQTCALKRTAVALARRWARREWDIHCFPAQLIVQGRDGIFQYEHTYGRDPRRSRG